VSIGRRVLGDALALVERAGTPATGEASRGTRPGAASNSRGIPGRADGGAQRRAPEASPLEPGTERGPARTRWVSANGRMVDPAHGSQPASGTRLRHYPT
ncbi:MAG: hypothetical protein ACREX8_05940, partial [Gammaproteobacteria bacterium]